MNFWQNIQKLPNNLVIVGIKVYKGILSPSEGILRFLPFYPKNTCIFHPTCSTYALLSYKKYPFFTATRKTIHRISRCHPQNTPTIDYP